ncbi:DUF2244 domain-containing protein [Frigidibacter mobilis]|uniref:Integral membrane protein-like protein n=1 Tax=Frigidibacter mobilis TaxID=1335048 RepID=A0A161GMA1_9RHOB|nr:DUF2244 domain-containing protein [Frigidibacter mobilis]AMY69923.1 integral membrane protein-like protein [Frigidibacter mobilis]
MPHEWVIRPAKAPEQSGAFPVMQSAEAIAAGLIGAAEGPPLAELHLWPYRSLPRRGFVLFIAVTAGLLLLPLLAVLGSPVLWGLLPFLMIAVGGVWFALQRSYRDGELLEVLRLFPARIELSRQDRRGTRRDWQANPYWVSLHLHPRGGPVPDYLTLKGNGREVELGAFLAQDERVALHGELREMLAGLR